MKYVTWYAKRLVRLLAAWPRAKKMMLGGNTLRAARWSGRLVARQGGRHYVHQLHGYQDWLAHNLIGEIRNRDRSGVSTAHEKARSIRIRKLVRSFDINSCASIRKRPMSLLTLTIMAGRGHG